MNFKEWRFEWFNRQDSYMTIWEKIISLFQLIFCYSPFLFFLYLMINPWIEGHFHTIQFVSLFVALYFSFYLQGFWPSGIFTKWDNFAIHISFPLAILLNFFLGQILKSVLEVVGFLFAELFAYAVGLGVLALGVFVIIGIFGVLLFGFKQVF